MKKLVALLLAMLLLASVALAEVITIEGTSLSLDIGDLVEFELDEEDDEDAVMVFGDEDETVECIVFVYPAEGDTLADIEAELAEEENIQAGYTTINGIEAYYCNYVEDGENYLEYFVIDGENIVLFSFWLGNEEGAALQAAVMNTLTK